MLTEKAVEEFKTLYLKEYGVQITDRQAIEYGSKLIRLVKIVYGSEVPRVWEPKVEVAEKND